METDLIANDEFIALLVESIGGTKGAGVLAAVGIWVKVVIAFLNTELMGKFFSGLKGSIKLLIVSILTMVSGVISLKLTGVSWSGALIHSATLTAFVTLSHDVYKTFFVKK